MSGRVVGIIVCIHANVLYCKLTPSTKQRVSAGLGRGIIFSFISSILIFCVCIYSYMHISWYYKTYKLISWILGQIDCDSDRDRDRDRVITFALRFQCMYMQIHMHILSISCMIWIGKCKCTSFALTSSESLENFFGSS